ncbi:unnamed protein product [Protopolystoma xenopodis]|uniref:Uncharacterized protein n=1 Tax=Protopolystoma xenopodis TaxID=117903 RepID=A0A448WTN8_9PLAT|nr:unnamed protein product [Protopolystoma xenopodis]
MSRRLRQPGHPIKAKRLHHNGNQPSSSVLDNAFRNLVFVLIRIASASFKDWGHCSSLKGPEIEASTALLRISPLFASRTQYHWPEAMSVHDVETDRRRLFVWLTCSCVPFSTVHFS